MVMRMSERKFGGFDLNLLAVFDALMTERHLSRAAERISRSQPAMSHALSRLRSRVGDRLFERGAQGLVPTRRALDLYAQIAPGLSQIHAALHGESRFDPTQSSRLFRIGMTDISSCHVTPALVHALRRAAPNIQLEVVDVKPDKIIQCLNNGDVEFALGMIPKPADLRAMPLENVTPVCIVDRHNSRVPAKGLDLATFAALDHVSVAMEPGTVSHIDRYLAERGLRRKIAVVVPHLLVMPFIVAGSELIAMCDAATIKALALTDRLAIHPAPADFHSSCLQLYWSPRHDADAGHRWLRELIGATVTPPSQRQTRSAPRRSVRPVAARPRRQKS